MFFLIGTFSLKFTTFYVEFFKANFNFLIISGSGNGNVGSSLGSHYASANSGCSSDRGSGGKRSLNSGSSVESNREFSSLTKQMNIFLRTKSDSGKRLSDEVRTIRTYSHRAL